jgi:beta-lactamase regulating signal transducer with metallopeptidase domain
MPFNSPSVFDVVIDVLNELGAICWDVGVAMFVETSILFALIGILDVVILRKRRTVVRYAVWSLLLCKLMLPISFPGPLSLVGVDERLWLQKLSHFISAPAPLAIQKEVAIFDEFISSLEQQRMNANELTVNDLAEAEATVFQIGDDLQQSEEFESVLDGEGWVMLLWMTCVSGLAILLLVRLTQVRRLIRTSRLPETQLQSLFAEILRDLSISGNKVTLRLSSDVHSPAICGLWKATILIPDALTKGLESDQLRLVLVHELMHWRRGDLYWNTLQSLLQIVYFYNPCVWFTNSILRRLREFRVDEETVTATGATIERYTTTLVDVTALSRMNRAIPAMSLGIVETRSFLSTRVQRILTRGLPSRTTLGWRGLTAVVLLASFLLPLSGCYRLAAAAAESDEFDFSLEPNSTNSNLVFLPEGPDSLDVGFDGAFDLSAHANTREQQALREMYDRSSDKLLALESLPDIKLTKSGDAETRLTAAGVTEVASDELVGIVVDADLMPVAGAKIDARYWDPGDVEVTNEQGLFRLKELDPRETPPLLITKEGYSPRIVVGHSTGAKDLIVILGNQTYLEGTVLDSDNKAVQGARIVASGLGVKYGVEGSRTRSIAFETTSGIDGKYRLYVCANKYDIKVHASQVGVARHSNIIVRPNQSVQQALRLERGIRFEAIVVDSETGQPFEGFTLFTHDSPKMNVSSGAQGKIVVEDMFPGFIEFQSGAGDKLNRDGTDYWQNGPLGRWWSPDAIHKDQQLGAKELDKNGYSKRGNLHCHFLTFDITPGMRPVKIIVERGVTVTGLVTDPEGKPVAGATVGMVGRKKGDKLPIPCRALTDIDGRYRVVLPASHKNIYSLFAHDGDICEWRNWANGVGEPFQSKPGAVIENRNIQLTRPGVIRGRLTSVGKPVADREVRLQRLDERESFFFQPTTWTAADGTFELRFVSPGKHYVQANPLYTPPTSDPKGVRVVEMKSGEVVENVSWDFKGK